jgi:hypothetical protein
MGTLSELVLQMHNDRKEINLALNRVQGWRGLLDPFCAEWHDSDIHQNVGVFRMLTEYRTFEQIIDLYLATEIRQYIIQDLPCAIFKLMEYFPEAKTYFFTNPRCTDSPYFGTLIAKVSCSGSWRIARSSSGPRGRHEQGRAE